MIVTSSICHRCAPSQLVHQTFIDAPYPRDGGDGTKMTFKRTVSDMNESPHLVRQRDVCTDFLGKLYGRINILRSTLSAILYQSFSHEGVAQNVAFCSLDTKRGVQNTSIVCIKSGQPLEPLDYMSSTAAPHATMRQSHITFKNHGRFLLPIGDASSYRSGRTLHRSGVFWVQVLGMSASLPSRHKCTISGMTKRYHRYLKRFALIIACSLPK